MASNWSEEWTLGSSIPSRAQRPPIAISGPSIYHDQTVDVVPKLEAEQRIEQARKQVLDGLRQGFEERLAEERSQQGDMHIWRASAFGDAIADLIALHPDPAALQAAIASIKGEGR